MATLSKSRIRRVVIVGRRGPLQVAFTLKEFRELTSFPSLAIQMNLQNIIYPALGASSDKEVQSIIESNVYQSLFKPIF